jgi:hypothetical protein
MEHGGKSVMIVGISMMPEWYVVNLGTNMLSGHFKMGRCLMVLDQHGYIRLLVVVVNEISLVVFTADLAKNIVRKLQV